MRIGQRQLNGDSHVRNSQLRHHSAIVEFHQRMDNALPMHHHGNLLRRHPVQPHGLDKFQALIQHGSTVDGDFLSHLPVGMLQSIRFFRRFQFLTGQSVEGTAGRGENQPFDLSPILTAHKTLEYGGMFAVDRNDLCAVQIRFRHDQFTGADQSLLVRQTNAFACPDSCQRGFQTHHTDYSRDDCISLRNGCRCQQTFPAPHNSDGGIIKVFFQLTCQRFCRHDRQKRSVFPALLCHAFQIGATGQRRHTDAQQIHYIQCLPANGACGAQNTDCSCHNILTLRSAEAESADTPPGEQPRSYCQTDREYRRVQAADCRSP